MMMQLKVKRKQNTALCAEFYKTSLKYSYQWRQSGRLRGSVQKQSAKLPLTQFNWLLDLYRNAFHDLNHSPQEHLRKNAISFSKSHVPCSFLPCKNYEDCPHSEMIYSLNQKGVSWLFRGTAQNCSLGPPPSCLRTLCQGRKGNNALQSNNSTSPILWFVSRKNRISMHGVLTMFKQVMVLVMSVQYK